MKTFLKIVGALFVVGLLFAGGCALLVGGAVHQASNDAAKSEKHFNASAKTFRVNFAQIKVGDVLSGKGGSSVAQVTALVGKPDTGDISRTTVGGDVMVTYDYHFYQATGAPSWVVSFDNGHVTDKSSL